jgi:hypothetical protein
MAPMQFGKFQILPNWSLMAVQSAGVDGDLTNSPDRDCQMTEDVSFSISHTVDRATRKLNERDICELPVARYLKVIASL